MDKTSTEGPISLIRVLSFVGIALSLFLVSWLTASAITVNRIVIEDQPLTDKGVYVKEVSLVRGGYLIIDDIHSPTSHVAMSGYLHSGKYKDIYLRYIDYQNYEPSNQPIEMYKPVQQGDYLVGFLYEDKGGIIDMSGYPNFSEIEYGTVVPLLDVLGRPVKKTVRIIK